MKLDLTIDLSLLVSVVAFAVSLYSLYRQYRVRGPAIEVLNSAIDQHVKLLAFNGLSTEIQEKFPSAQQSNNPEYALVKLVYGNSGDRTGLAIIQSITLQEDDSDGIETFYNPYTMIPAYEIVENEILLRDYVQHFSEKDKKNIRVEIRIERVGYHPRSGRSFRSGTIVETLPVTIPNPHYRPF